MTSTITLQGWPSAPGCIAWSHDHIVAIGLKDIVTLLVPNYRQSPDAPPAWKQVIIDAGRFSKLEWPLHNPASWNAFSIGEELSERDVIALEWSRPGLGLFGRPVLAILTANSALSIWECSGKPELRSDWHRVVVVNNVLLDTAALANDGSYSEQKDRRTRRIRCFSCSKGLFHSGQPVHAASTQFISTHFMSISDDTGLVTAIRIQSPHDLMSTSMRQWTCTKVTAFEVNDLRTPPNKILECLTMPKNDSVAVAEQLSWSSWTQDSHGTPVSTLAFNVNSRLLLKTVKMKYANGKAHFVINDFSTAAHPDLDRTIRSPLVWQANDLYLVLDEALFKVSIGYSEAAKIEVSKIRTGCSPWSQISSISINHATSSETAILSITKYHQTGNIGILDLHKLSETGDCVTLSPETLQQLQAVMHDVEKRQNMSERILAKIHCASISPFGQFMVACATFHPTEGLEYTIDARQETAVAISMVPSADTMVGIDNLKELVSLERSVAVADGMLLGAISRQRYTLSDLDGGDYGSLNKLQLQIFGSLEAAVASADHGEVDSDNLQGVSLRVRQQVVRNNIVMISRQETLLNNIKSGSDYSANLDLGIVEVLSRTICELPNQLSQGHAYSSTVRIIHATIYETLLSRKQHSSGGPPPQPRTGIAHEICELCGEGIHFESLRWSRCEKGHQYIRCGLTFLSIQGVGQSKSCGICGIQYYNEHKMKALQGIKGEPDTINGDGSLTEPLLRVVFTAFDVCIYCTGRYVC